MMNRILFLLMLLILVACSKSEGELFPGENPGDPSISERSLKTDLRKLAESSTFKIWLCSHRGNTQKGIAEGIPENSLKALDQAIIAGAEIVEIDVRSTLDGVLVLMHDKTIDRTTNGSGTLSNISYEQLKEYKLKDAKGNVTEESVPTLEEALKQGKGKIYFNLDIANKDIPVRKIVSLLQRLHMIDETLLYVSTDRNYASDLQSIDNGLLLHPMVASSEDITYFTSRLSGIQVLQLSTSNAISGVLAKEIREKGLLVFSNIVGGNDTNMLAGSYSGLVNMINKRVALIQTDYTELADMYLKSKGYR